MNAAPRKITLSEWDERYRCLRARGMDEPEYGGPLRRHADDGDLRLNSLLFDNSCASLRLWNFLLTEEDRLREARAAGHKLVGCMKDLGTVPVMAYALPSLTAFYPDGAWWIPCVMEFSGELTGVAESMGLNDTFCPVRAVLGAFVTQAHFPLPDLLTCSVGATCDDFSAVAQRLEHLGHSVVWWEVPHRRKPDPDEAVIFLPGGMVAPTALAGKVRQELERVGAALGELAGEELSEARLVEGIRAANAVRRRLAELRRITYTARRCPLPALEMQIAEMLAIHFCSEQAETARVLDGLLSEVRRRAEAGVGILPEDAARVFWVNPVADLRAMNVLEECGARVCGTDYMFAHALDPIPEDVPPLEALARMVLADPMVGPASDRAERVCRDARLFGAEGVVVSRIPGASHCATEGTIIAEVVSSRMGIPVVELEIPSVCDAILPTLKTRIEALVETIRERRTRCCTQG